MNGSAQHMRHRNVTRKHLLFINGYGPYIRGLGRASKLGGPSDVGHGRYWSPASAITCIGPLGKPLKSRTNSTHRVFGHSSWTQGYYDDCVAFILAGMRFVQLEHTRHRALSFRSLEAETTTVDLGFHHQKWPGRSSTVFGSDHMRPVPGICFKKPRAVVGHMWLSARRASFSTRGTKNVWHGCYGMV